MLTASGDRGNGWRSSSCWLSVDNGMNADPKSRGIRYVFPIPASTPCQAVGQTPDRSPPTDDLVQTASTCSSGPARCSAHYPSRAGAGHGLHAGGRDGWCQSWSHAAPLPQPRVGDFAAISFLSLLVWGSCADYFGRNCPIDKGSRHLLRLGPLKKGPGVE